MELILWRHAEAAEGLPDDNRPLTARGLHQAETMARFLAPHLPKNTRVLVSPAQRAQQTARALTKHFITEPVVGGTSAQAILDFVGWPDAPETVVVVGHQPVLGVIAAKLLSDQDATWSIKKGAVWWLSRREREGDFQTLLRLAITPDYLP